LFEKGENSLHVRSEGVRRDRDWEEKKGQAVGRFKKRGKSTRPKYS